MTIAQKSPLNTVFSAHTAHYHITLGNVTSEELAEAAALIAGKATPIDLIMNNTTMQDRMVTKHQAGISVIPMLLDVQTLIEAGYTVIRHKLEMDFLIEDVHTLLPLPLNAHHYIEIHAKMSADIEPIDIEGFAYSSNPKAMGYYFYNTRIRNWDDLDDRLKGVQAILQRARMLGHPVRHVHHEYTLFDSHIHHDNAWA